MAKIIIADNQTLLREGLHAILNSFESCDVIAHASNGKEIMSLIKEHEPDVLFLDPKLPELGGLGAISRLMQNARTPLLIIALADENENLPIRETIHAGAKGYISKSVNLKELEFAITSILKGLVYVSPSIANQLVNGKTGDNFSLEHLSNREKEVFKLLAEGHPNREVAKLLHISPRTIDSHRRNILKKLSLKNNADLVQKAIKLGII